MTTRTFQFRAQPALDLRRRQHDEALRVLTALEADLQAAERTLRAAEAGEVQARTQYTIVMQSSSASPGQEWYRSWILRRERERAAAERAVAVRHNDCATARATYLAAKQQLDALERLKDNAKKQWQAEMAAEEQKQFDELATMRHAAHRGDHSDNAAF
jgi:flagellar export protein FliJ